MVSHPHMTATQSRPPVFGALPWKVPRSKVLPRLQKRILGWFRDRAYGTQSRPCWLYWTVEPMKNQLYNK